MVIDWYKRFKVGDFVRPIHFGDNEDFFKYRYPDLKVMTGNCMRVASVFADGREISFYTQKTSEWYSAYFELVENVPRKVKISELV